MKKIYNSDSLSIKEKVKSKKILNINITISNILYFLTLLIANGFINVVMGTKENIFKVGNFLLMLFGSIPYCLSNTLREHRIFNDTTNENIGTLMNINAVSDLNISEEELNNAFIKSTKSNDIYYLWDGKGTKVKRKRVISYIALSRKDKLLILKQIVSYFKFDDKNMKDSFYSELYLLEDEDLRDENFILEDGSYNVENSFIKKLINKEII